MRPITGHRLIVNVQANNDADFYADDGATQTPLVLRGTLPYLVYTALLDQSGTGAPAATILQNTIGAIVWSRVGPGQYFGTLTAAFTSNRTFVCISQMNETVGGGSSYSRFGINRQSANQVLVDTQFVDGTPQVFLADSLLVKASVEIRVYPA
jgi:hypothetical protein